MPIGLHIRVAIEGPVCRAPGLLPRRAPTLMSGLLVRPARRLHGSLRVPGDKSISHRALMLAAVGEGECSIQGLSSSLDVRATRAALQCLRATISDSHPQVEDEVRSSRAFDFQILVRGRGWEGLAAPTEVLDCANSGTTARTLLGVLAGRPLQATLDGDASLRGRPMLRVVEPLRSMGAGIEGPGGGDRLPLVIRGGPLTGIEHRLAVASAQVKTALILAGLQAAGETRISEPHPSRDHTERLLAHLGVQIDRDINQLVVRSTNIRNVSSLSIPGDLSSAAFLLVAGSLLPGSEVRVEEVGLNPTRTGILDVLRSFGADVRVADARESCGEPRGTVVVRAGDRRPLTLGAEDVPRTLDELPLVAVLGALAEGETVIHGAAELRVKESDRISAIARGLAAMGARIDALPDGLAVHGPCRLRGASVDAGGDHRIAMALAVAALAAEGETSIEGWESVAVSYPEFERDLEALLER